MKPSTYRLSTKVVLQNRNRQIDLAAADTWLGLLASCPTPEGSEVYEIENSGYERQRLVLAPSPGPAGAMSPRNLHMVAFDVSASAIEASHGGIFDGAGRLLSYGWLQNIGTGDPNSIAFQPGEIQLAYR